VRCLTMGPAPSRLIELEPPYLCLREARGIIVVPLLIKYDYLGPRIHGLFQYVPLPFRKLPFNANFPDQ
jgi:hypothetical protein